MKVYVASKGPVVAVTTSEHTELNKDTLQKVIERTVSFAKTLHASWDKNNWFPCGFVNGKVAGDSPLVKFVKKNGIKEADRNEYNFDCLEVSKAYGTGYLVYLRFDRGWGDAITCQCMNFKAQVYQELVKQLAFLNIEMSVSTMVD